MYINRYRHHIITNLKKKLYTYRAGEFVFFKWKTKFLSYRQIQYIPSFYENVVVKKKIKISFETRKKRETIQILTHALIIVENKL